MAASGDVTFSQDGVKVHPYVVALVYVFFEVNLPSTFQCFTLDFSANLGFAHCYTYLTILWKLNNDDHK